MKMPFICILLQESPATGYVSLFARIFLQCSTKSVTRQIGRITLEWRLIMVLFIAETTINIYNNNPIFITFPIRLCQPLGLPRALCHSCQTCSVKHCKLPWEVFSRAAITGHITHQEECYCAAGPRQHDVVTHRLEEKPSSKGRNHSKSKHKLILMLVHR